MQPIKFDLNAVGLRAVRLYEDTEKKLERKAAGIAENHISRQEKA